VTECERDPYRRTPNAYRRDTNGATDAGRPVTIRDITDRLQKKQALAFQTVMTVMNRLADKGLLARSGARGSRTYRAALDREAFLRAITRDVAAGLIRDFGDLAVAQFVDALAEHDAAALVQLEQALRRRKAAHEPR